MTRTLLFATLALLLPTLCLSSQTPVFSLASNASTGQLTIRDEELCWLDPAGGSRVLLPRESLNLFVGDSNHNGFLDDAPADIDACHVAGPHGGSDFYLSSTTTFHLADGTSVLDGDIWRFNEQGQLEILYPESFFTSISGTSGVDVDAFTIDQGGTLFWSFAEDETTSLQSLINENGGNPVLDEQVVLSFSPGDTAAHLHFSLAQVTSFFSQATAGSFSTVVDVTGLCVDPTGQPGDLLMVSGSTSQALRGRIVSSKAGGTLFQVGGQPVDPTLIGLGSTISLDALSLLQAAPYPVLRAFPDIDSSTSGGPGSLVVQGLQPGDPVQLVVTPPLSAGAPAIAAVAPFGFGAIYLDSQSPMWFQSFQWLPFALVADAFGEARFSFSFQGAPPGLLAAVQAFRPGTLELSNPVAVSVLP